MSKLNKYNYISRFTRINWIYWHIYTSTSIKAILSCVFFTSLFPSLQYEESRILQIVPFIFCCCLSLCFHIVGIAPINDIYWKYRIILPYLSQNWSLNMKPSTLFTISLKKHTLFWVRIGEYTYLLFINIYWLRKTDSLHTSIAFGLF